MSLFLSLQVVTQRSRPLAILSQLRRLLHAEYKTGRLDSQSFYFLETDLKELDEVVESYARTDPHSDHDPHPYHPPPTTHPHP